MKPLHRAPAPPDTIDFFVQEYGFTRQQAISCSRSSEFARLTACARQVSETYINDTYLVEVFQQRPYIRLAIRRLDFGVIEHDWREFQEIKNQIVGPEIEACELYPAESRKVDTCNVYHLWCIPAGELFPFGFTERAVSDYSRDEEAGNFRAFLLSDTLS